MILDAAGGAGPAESSTDSDGFVRRVPIRDEVDGQMLPGFVHQLHAMAAGGGIPARPFPAGKEILVNWRGGPGTFPRISYYQVLAGEVRPEAIRGKIVLVGATSPAMHDVVSTPFAGALMAGVEAQVWVVASLIMATALGTFLAFVLGGVWVRSVGMILALAFGLLAAIVLVSRRAPGNA